MPGSSDITSITAPDMPSAFGYPESWPSSALSAAPDTPAFDTSKPAAVETISAGTCVTRPSPTVRIV